MSEPIWLDVAALTATDLLYLWTRGTSPDLGEKLRELAAAQAKSALLEPGK